MLHIENDYIAYCVDEAAAWLLGQKKPPNYGDSGAKPTIKINDKKTLQRLAAAGLADVK